MSTKSNAGRPSKYKPEYAQELLDYFGVDPYEEKLIKVVTKSGDVIEVPKDVASDFPTLAGFAIKIGVHRDTLLEWSKEYPEFSGAYKRAIDFQENWIAINGNKGLVPPVFAIFTAKNVLKWRDRQPDEIDTVINNNVNGLTDEDLDEKIKKLTEGKNE